MGRPFGPKLRTKKTENMGGNWKDQTKEYPKPIQRWNPPILESFSLILLDIELQQKGKLIEFLCLSSIFRARIKCAFCHNCFALSHFLGGGLIVCGPCWATLQQPMRRPSWASRTFSMLPPSHPSSSEERRGCKTPK